MDKSCIKGIHIDECPYNPRLGCDCGVHKPDWKPTVGAFGVYNENTTGINVIPEDWPIGFTRMDVSKYVVENKQSIKIDK